MITNSHQMKTIKITLLGLLFGFGALHAQDKRVAIKINPLSLFAITGNVQAEFFITPKMSAQLGVFYGQLQTGFGGGGATSKIKYNWLGVTPEFRYYFGVGQVASQAGLYVAGFARYRSVALNYQGDAYDPDSQTYVSGDVKGKVSAVGGGILVGYQLMTKGGFVFDSYIGPQFSSARFDASVNCVGCNGNETVSESAGLNFSGPGLRFGIALGYAF